MAKTSDPAVSGQYLTFRLGQEVFLDDRVFSSEELALVQAAGAETAEAM